MKTIQLTNSDQVVLVDDDLFDYLNQWRWQLHSQGYVSRSTKSNGHITTFLMHRVIMKLLCTDKIQVDHIDHNKLNNQRNNLRYATNQQNHGNTNKNTVRSSKYKGVHLERKTGKFIAQIRFNYRKQHIGTFITEIEAARAYNQKAIELFGEYARLNDV